jgi:predicted Fe-Mo cluster-binding NifX family protein
MKVAIPVWNNCVSSAFDFANRLLLVDIDNGSENKRTEIALSTESIPQKANELKNLGVDVLICGAISRALASQVISSGIELLPYVLGPVDEILQAYLTDQLGQPRFAMPCSWPGARRAFRRRRRCQRGKRGHQFLND